MATATYVLQAPAHAGQQLAMVTPVSGDTIQPGQGIGLLVINPVGGTQITVQLTLLSEDSLTGPVRTVTIPANTNWLIPVPDAVYGTQPVPLTYSGTLTNVLVAAVRIP